MPLPLWFIGLVFGGFVTAAIGYGLRRRSGAPGLMPAPVVLDPANDKSISVSGYSEPELQQIRQQFVLQYSMSDRFVFTRLSGRNDRWRITFPDDLTPEQLFFLVNYLNYPEGIPLDQRAIGVLGRCTVTPAFQPPDSALVGSGLEIYVPADDQSGDQVYLRVGSGQIFRCALGGLVWRPVAEARFPRQTQGLS
jgi:hypothetical protein